MPPQRQQRLGFERVVVQRSLCITLTREDNTQSPTPLITTLAKLVATSPASTPLTPLAPKEKIQTS